MKTRALKMKEFLNTDLSEWSGMPSPASIAIDLHVFPMSMSQPFIIFAVCVLRIVMIDFHGNFIFW